MTEMDQSPKLLTKQFCKLWCQRPEVAETVKGINDDVHGTPWFQQKKKDGQSNATT